MFSPLHCSISTRNIFSDKYELPGVKIGGRNINNLQYADDTVLLAETEEDLQKIVDQVKRERKFWTSNECKENKDNGILQEQ